MTRRDASEGNPHRDLVQKGNHKLALASLDQCIQKHPNDGLLYRERAHVHLYFGRLQQARSDFDVAARLNEEIFRTRAGRLHADGEYNAIGATYWIEGHKELALGFWRYTTSLLHGNGVSYSTMGGGIEAGLLLWFGAVHMKHQDDVDLVRRFYEKRLVSTLWSHNLDRWPGSIVRFFLNQIDERQLINDASDCHQKLCKAHFAAAVRARELRRYAAYQKYMKLAVPGKGPQEVYEFYNVYPYFLARFETGQSP